MPNHVRNIINMNNITKLPLFEIEKEEKYFDFNKLIPMPESLNLECGGIQNLAIESVLVEISNRYKINIDLYEQEVCTSGYTKEELKNIGLKYITNQILYGYQTWYDWRMKNWDTKWNSYDNRFVDTNTIIFNTAWNAPHKVIEALMKKYPDKVIEHYWADEELGVNSGFALYKNGRNIEFILNDNYQNEAYETFIKCWGESDCLYKDEYGNWQKHNCDNCDSCVIPF